MPDLRVGERVGRWTLGEKLGAGGNAEVWRASDGSQEVALKVLKNRNPNSEPYERFRNEVIALGRIGSRVGVLPLLDSDLPAQLGKGQRAWLAMPQAVPLQKALADASLAETVSTMARIAAVLAELKSEFKLHHRDIKPANLYDWQGVPAIGDFGLVDLPDGAQLTNGGKPLGPVNFIPYEMLNDPVNAEPGPADVYSLAKTLWVLCTRQNWPPPGHQDASAWQFSIRAFQPHPQAVLLDQLIDRATRSAAEDRPTMAEVAADLDAWGRLRTEAAGVPDLSGALQALRALAQPRLSEEARLRQLKADARDSARRLEELLAPLHSAIRDGFPEAEFDRHEKLVVTMAGFLHHLGSAQIVAADDRATVIRGDGLVPMSLVLGRWVGTTDDGILRARACCFIGRLGVMGSVTSWTSEPLAAPSGSTQVELGLRDIVREIGDRMPGWLETLHSEWAAAGG